MIVLIMCVIALLIVSLPLWIVYGFKEWLTLVSIAIAWSLAAVLLTFMFIRIIILIDDIIDP